MHGYSFDQMVMGLASAAQAHGLALVHKLVGATNRELRWEIQN